MNNYRPIKTKIFLKFLKANGCYRMQNKSGGSHSYWKRAGLFRRIVVREADKDIPAFHIKTNLETLGLDIADLFDFMAKK